MSSCGNRQPRNGLSRAHEFPSALNMLNLNISCIPFRTVRTSRPLFAVRSSRHFDRASRAASGPPTSNTRELIAPAVAITLRCDGCIAVHLAAAGEPGATREEIAEPWASVSASTRTRPWFILPARLTPLTRRRENDRRRRTCVIGPVCGRRTSFVTYLSPKPLWRRA